MGMGRAVTPSRDEMRIGRRALLAGSLCVPLCLLCPSVSIAQVGTAPKAPTPVWSVAFSPDGKTLAAGGYKQVQLYDVVARQPLKTLTGLAGPVRCLAWSADGARLAAGTGLPGESGEICLFTMPDGVAAKPLKLHKDVIEGLAFPPTGETVLSAGIDEKALAVEVATGKVLKTMQDHTNRVVAIAVSPKGRFIATGSLDKTIKIWSPEFLPLANIDNTGGQIFALTFVADNQLAATGEDGNVRIFTLAESRSGNIAGVNVNLARTINGNRTPLFTLSAGKNVLAYGGEDHVIRLFDLTSTRRSEIKDCPDAIYGLSVTPDGTLLAACGRDGRVRLFTTADGKLAAELG